MRDIGTLSLYQTGQSEPLSEKQQFGAAVSQPSDSITMPESMIINDMINLRYQDGSEGSLSNPAKFNDQDFVQLKQHHLSNGTLFVDTAFPPENKSLGDLPNLPWWLKEQVEWLRPADIVKGLNIQKELSFFQEETSIFDFSQGILGNRWFLSAIASLKIQKELLVQIVPLEQSFQDYVGIFHFRFWLFGKWVDVVIDDYLPTLNKEFLSVRSTTGNDFWVPLLEKAYAKICGSYEALNIISPVEAFKDLSGGVHIAYSLKAMHDVNNDIDLWASLTRATERLSMICCGTSLTGERMINTITHTGLLDGYVYTITAVTEINHKGSKIRLVRLVNPWGKQWQWNGRWSETSSLWDEISTADRARCFESNDGEFWMELQDFCFYFKFLSIFSTNPTFIDGDTSGQWKCMVYDGKWIAGRTAGGSIISETFWMNPQYRIKVDQLSKYEEDDKNVLISLMQKPLLHSIIDSRIHGMAISIFQLPEGTPEGRLDATFFKNTLPLTQRFMYLEDREVMQVQSLPAGEYLIVPSTIKLNAAADFALIIYTKIDATIRVFDGLSSIVEHRNIISMTKEKDQWTMEKRAADSDKWMADADKKTADIHDEKIYDMFRLYADQNQELNYRQLQKLLNDNLLKGTIEGFDLETCRSLIAMMDTDYTRHMTFSEFSHLWTKIEEFKKVFIDSDFEQHGTLNPVDLQTAINSAGINLDKSQVNLLLARYADSTISLDSFLTLMLRLEKISKIFNNKSTDGVVSLTWNELSNTFLYA